MQSNGNGTEVWEKGIQVDLPDGEYEIEVQMTGKRQGVCHITGNSAGAGMRRPSSRSSGAALIMTI